MKRPNSEVHSLQALEWKEYADHLEKQNDELETSLKVDDKALDGCVDENINLKQQNDELLKALKEIERQTSCFYTGIALNQLIQKAGSVFDSIKVPNDVKNKVDNRFNDLDQKAEGKDGEKEKEEA